MNAPLDYATDGQCHNAEPGTFNHECGKPATFIGRDEATGFESGFCDDCKERGWEARGKTFRPIEPTALSNTLALGRMLRGIG